MEIPYWFPTNKIPKGDKTVEPLRIGITHVHHFYTKRNCYIVSCFLNKINFVNKRLQNFLRCVLQSFLFHLSRLNRKVPGGIGRHLVGTLFIPSLNCEVSFFQMIERKLSDFYSAVILNQNVFKILITLQSSTNLPNIPSNSIDYIFTDPPFGSNLMYSELNFIWEAWLKVFTNNKSEAVINKTQRKGLYEYQVLMEKCFSENYRILKPGRWMTVEFHNSKNSIWNAIQEAILKAGFVIANVKTLDKKQGTFNQMTGNIAVKQDMIISAYKPKDSFIQNFLSEAGTEEGAWNFIREHLAKLPIVVEENGMINIIPERQNYLLYDSMIAFHIQKGATIPLGAADFYRGLDQRFPERDGMYFLPNQVNEYDAKRIKHELNEQLSFIIMDEKTALQWLRTELYKPQTYQDIQPKFLQELKQLKHEKMPELLDMLKENFLQDDSGRWYVPDINKQSDLEKLREKKLLKEFEEYKTVKGRLKVFRTEAIRAGFKYCWSEKDYETIINIGERLPESVIQEDAGILMYYDNALTRMGK